MHSKQQETLAEVSQGHCELSLLRDSQKSSGHSFGQWGLGCPAWTGGWSLGGSFQLQPISNSAKTFQVVTTNTRDYFRKCASENKDSLPYDSIPEPQAQNFAIRKGDADRADSAISCCRGRLTTEPLTRTVWLNWGYHPFSPSASWGLLASKASTNQHPSGRSPVLESLRLSEILNFSGKMNQYFHLQKIPFNGESLTEHTDSSRIVCWSYPMTISDYSSIREQVRTTLNT